MSRTRRSFKDIKYGDGDFKARVARGLIPREKKAFLKSGQKTYPDVGQHGKKGKKLLHKYMRYTDKKQEKSMEESTMAENYQDRLLTILSNYLVEGSMGIKRLRRILVLDLMLNQGLISV